VFVTRVTRRLVDQELLALPEHVKSLSVFSEVCAVRSLVSCIVYVIVGPFVFFFWSLCCLFFCDLRHLITSFEFFFCYFSVENVALYLDSYCLR